MSARLRLAVLAAGSLLAAVVGCSVVAPTSTVGPPTPTTGPPTPTPTQGPTCPPAASAPPGVTMLDTNGNDVAGRLGGWSWCGGGTEAPWPPASGAPSLTLSHDEINVVASTDDGTLFVGWTAQYAPANAAGPGSPHSLTTGSNQTGVDTVSFAGPPTGDWILSMTLLYAGKQGTATYFWHAAAP